MVSYREKWGLSLLAMVLLSPVKIMAEETGDRSPARRAEAALAENLPSLRTDVRSLRIPAGRLPPLSMPEIEKFFDAPLSVFSYSEQKLSQLEQGPLLSDRMTSICGLFGKDRAPLESKDNAIKLPTPPASVPASLKPALTELYKNLFNAKIQLDRALASVPKEQRAAYLKVLEDPPLSSRKTKEMYEGMKAFDDDAMIDAARWFSRGIDGALADLPAETELAKSVVWDTPLGTFVLNGKEDDTMTEDQLKDVAVLIDFGGRNSYAGPVAAARDGQVRLVIDYGTDVTIYSAEVETPNAGSGLFGAGALIFPNGEGLKKVISPSFSQGCGIGGVGIFVAQGPVQLEGRRFVQGVGSFGIGLMQVTDGFRSTYNAQRSAQGLGLTHGVGVFLHHGDAAEVKGGLVEPDPREPLATISLCQGVGYGPRGYTGGGVGIALIQGSSMTVSGSYFAQGVGYWHGLGIFRLKGNDNTVLARRYDQGSGVHSAFGHFSLEGDRNTVLNWGVGPAYGWDRAAGSALVLGDNNQFQTEWGAAQGSIGGLSLSYWSGTRNSLSLAQFGTGSFFRDDLGRSLHVIEGADNRLKYGVSAGSDSYSIQMDPWAFIRLTGGRLESEIKPIPVKWSDLPRLPSTVEEVNLPGMLEEAKKKGPAEELEDLIDIAAAFNLNKEAPRTALEEVLRTSTANVPGLVELLDPAAVDQLIQLRIALAAFGPETAQAILKILPSAPEERKGFYLNFLDASSAAETIPLLQKMVDTDPDPRQKARALMLLARFFNLDTGNEPGQRAALRAIVRYLHASRKPAVITATSSLLNRLFVSDAFGILAKTVGLDGDSRVEFLRTLPPDLTETIGPKGAVGILDRLSHEKNALAAFEAEVGVLEGFEPQVRHSVLAQLGGTPEVVTAALIALGQIANPKDAEKIAPHLKSSDPRIREAATTALGRLGDAGLGVLKKAFRKGDPLTRKVVLAAVPLSTSDDSESLIEMGLDDSEPSVRLAAVGSLLRLPPALERHRARLQAMAKRKASSEKDPSVRVALLAAAK